MGVGDRFTLLFASLVLWMLLSNLWQPLTDLTGFVASMGGERASVSRSSAVRSLRVA